MNKFRPELLLRLKNIGLTKLNPDAYSTWNSPNEIQKTDEEIKLATDFLIQDMIPRCAMAIDEKQWQYFDLANLLHLFGINVRFLGMIRHHTKSPKMKAIILIEMIARGSNYSSNFRLLTFYSCQIDSVCTDENKKRHKQQLGEAIGS